MAPSTSRSKDKDKDKEKEKERAERGKELLERFMHYHNRLPYYYYVHVILLAIYLLCYLCGWLHYLIGWYIFCLFFSPQASWEVSFTLIRRCFVRFPGFPLTYNITALGILFSRVLLTYPIETAMYYIDEIVFPGYKETVIKDPFAIIGQPRSGTTKFESILEGDEDLLCLKMYELRWPYLCYQYGVDAVCAFDAAFMNGAIEKLFRDLKLHHVYNEEGSERPAMRRLRFDMADEDDIIFLFHFFQHFQIMAVVPEPFTVSFAHHFDRLSALEKKRMFEFHKRAVQKVLYRRGKGKRYFAKWVLTWCGVMQEAVEAYPDMKFLVMVRNPQEQLRSWFKLQGLLSLDLTGHNVLESPPILEEVKKINIEFYNNQVNLLASLDPAKRRIFNFHTFYNDIQKSTREVYEFLGKEIVPDSKFDKFLREQTQQQLTHKATATDDHYLTDAEIKERFPDLMAILIHKGEEESKKDR